MQKTLIQMGSTLVIGATLASVITLQVAPNMGTAPTDYEPHQYVYYEAPLDSTKSTTAFDMVTVTVSRVALEKPYLEQRVSNVDVLLKQDPTNEGLLAAKKDSEEWITEGIKRGIVYSADTLAKATTTKSK